MPSSHSRLRELDTDTGERIICHVDMDCFYAACERLREPELIGEPVIVGMGYESAHSGGVVATASYEAREFDISSAQPIADALERLPREDLMPDDYAGPVGYYRPVDMAYYRSISATVRSVFSTVADTVRVASLDEAYLDVTPETTWDGATSFARSLKERIAEAAGVPASVGIAPTLGVAKIASDYDKPDGETIVPPAEVAEFLADLPVSAIHGVGPVTADALHDMGLATIDDIARANIELLEGQLGQRGREIYFRAHGAGTDIVEPQGRPKSLSKECSFSPATSDSDIVRAKLRTLARQVAVRASEKDALYRTIGIKVVTPPFDVQTREQSFSGPFSDPEILEETALSLFEEFDSALVRKVGARVSNLEFGGNQTTLDDLEGSESADLGQTESVPTFAKNQHELSDFF